MQYKSDVEAIEALVGKYSDLKKEIGKVIIGQENVVRDVLISIFSRGHCLLIGVPGLAKTLLISTVSRALGLSFNRIQFTPDLMPSDIVGTEILDETKRFRFLKGPIFANIILADEINRTPPKTQSALLEAMQEKSVSVAGTTYMLEEPFFVLATQNPIEQEGTYPLPEAQLDRFMFNIWLDYPTRQQELDIVKATTIDKTDDLNVIMTSEETQFFQKLVRRIPVPDNVFNYAVSLASLTRPNQPGSHEWANKFLTWGAGPRASQFLIIGAKTHAALRGKYSPDIEDVRAVAIAVLRHRFVRNYRSEAEGVTAEDIVKELLKNA